MLFMAGFLAGTFYGTHPSVSRLHQDLESVEDQFADSGGDRNIPRVVVVQGLFDYLRILEVDPKSQAANDGAVQCYLALGAMKEAKSLRDHAVSLGVPSRSMDAMLKFHASS